MHKEFNHERAVYYPPYDLAAGMHVDRVKKVLLDDIPEEASINDAIEYHQAKLTVEKYPEFFDSDALGELIERSTDHFSAACRLIHCQLSDKSLLEISNELELQYFGKLIDLVVASGAQKLISQDDMEAMLCAYPNLISQVLAYGSLADKYCGAIKRFLLANPIFAAEFLIGEFGSERRNSESLVAPRKLSSDEIDSLMIEYLAQERVNLNHVRVLQHWPVGKSALNYSPSPEVQVLAKRKAEQLNNEVAASGLSIHQAIGIIFDGDQKACKSINITDEGFNLSYSSQWLSEHSDCATILNNLIYVFELIDSTGLLMAPAHKREQSTLFSIMGLHVLGEYPTSIQFQHRNQMAIGIVHLYRLFLESSGQNRLESAIEWAFGDYVKSEFNIDGFSISLPTKETSCLDKCKSIGPEIERVTKAFQLLSTKGEIDEEFFAFISIKNFADVKSLIDRKYVEAGSAYEEHASLLFSDQSRLAFSENHKGASQQFFAMILEERVVREDFHDIYQPAIEKLLEDGTLEIDNEGVLHPTKKAAMLKLIWDKGAIEICKYSEEDKAMAEELVDLGWLAYSNSLFTSDESAYLNYMFNDAEFSNSLALRNKYDHGTFRVNDPDSDEYATDYAGLLNVLISITLKIFDDLSLKYEAGGVEDFVDWPLIDDSVASAASRLM